MSDNKQNEQTNTQIKIDEEIKKTLEEIDSGSRTRTLTGPVGLGVSALAIAFAIFQLYTATFGVLDAYLQRAVHLGFGLSLVYLLYPTRKSWSRKTIHPVDAILAMLAVVSPAYVIISYKELVMRAGIVTNTDFYFGLLGFILVVEATRRVVGIPMLGVATVFIIYAFAGPHIPGDLAHRGVSLTSLIGHLYYTTEGIFGIPLGVSATFVFLFILFSAFLEKTGLGKLFIDLANALAGWAVGGPAKVVVLSSAMMGTLSGSSVANVAATGGFTIPMMKSLGYDKNFAGAVEAASSTGGQIIPPIMGAAAFLMMEFVGVSFVTIIKAALIPAILYFCGIWICVHLEAKKNNLKGLPREQLPNTVILLKEKGHLLIPLIAVIYLLSTGYTPMRAALWAIALTIGSAMLRKSTRIGFMDIVRGLENGAKGALGVVVACASAGIIIGVITQTGVGLKVASMMMEMAGGILILGLFFTMIASLLLGIGVPTTANYVITSTIAAPALLLMGVPPLVAHMFVFYFGIMADITPPVALAAFAATGISKGDPLLTGLHASKLAIGAFIVPYVFVFSPELLMYGDNVTFFGIISVALTAIIGMVGVSSGLVGYFVTKSTIFERIISIIGGLTLINPGILTDLIGIAILAFVYFMQKRREKNTDTPIANA